MCKIRIGWRGEEAFAGLYGDANLFALSVTRPRVRIRPVDCCHDFFLRPSRRRANECQTRKCVNQVSIHHRGRHPRRLSLLFRSWLFLAPHRNDKMIYTIKPTANSCIALCSSRKAVRIIGAYDETLSVALRLRNQPFHGTSCRHFRITN